MKNTLFIYALAAILGIGAAATALQYMRGPQTDYAAVLARASSIVIEKPIEEKFAILLENFLHDVSRQAEEYKNQRRVLTELVKPPNLRSPDYIEENYQIAQEVLPDLRARMEHLMGTFSRVDAQVQQLLSNAPLEKKKYILGHWHKMKTEQASTYVGFFSFEDQLLRNYEDLIALYYAKRQQITVDLERNAVRLQNRIDEEKKDALLYKIEMGTRAQNRGLQQ